MCAIARAFYDARNRSAVTIKGRGASTPVVARCSNTCILHLFQRVAGFTASTFTDDLRVQELMPQVGRISLQVSWVCGMMPVICGHHQQHPHPTQAHRRPTVVRMNFSVAGHTSNQIQTARRANRARRSRVRYCMPRRCSLGSAVGVLPGQGLEIRKPLDVATCRTVADF